MLDQSTQSDQVRELDSRLSDGIHVRLLWRSSGGRVWGAVSDAKAGEAFSVPVRSGERALEVFHHPYACASWARRVEV